MSSSAASLFPQLSIAFGASTLCVCVCVVSHDLSPRVYCQVVADGLKTASHRHTCQQRTHSDANCALWPNWPKHNRSTVTVEVVVLYAPKKRGRERGTGCALARPEHSPSSPLSLLLFPFACAVLIHQSVALWCLLINSAYLAGDSVP